mgnify:CR=1 FL=1
MAQDYLKFNGITMPVPDQDGYTVQIATTSTDDSDRTQDLVMHNTPIGSVMSYGLKWTDLTKEEVALILTQVLNRPSFSAHYFDVKTATWRDAEFYATTFNITPIDLTEDDERIEELSFNIIGVNPI